MNAKTRDLCLIIEPLGLSRRSMAIQSLENQVRKDNKTLYKKEQMEIKGL